MTTPNSIKEVEKLDLILLLFSETRERKTWFHRKTFTRTFLSTWFVIA